MRQNIFPENIKVRDRPLRTLVPQISLGPYFPLGPRGKVDILCGTDNENVGPDRIGGRRILPVESDLRQHVIDKACAPGGGIEGPRETARRIEDAGGVEQLALQIDMIVP